MSEDYAIATPNRRINIDQGLQRNHCIPYVPNIQSYPFTHAITFVHPPQLMSPTTAVDILWTLDIIIVFRNPGT